MYLKNLTIKGFKSFADRTVFHFEPGVTVVVGPNGSGKSNITDAVLWVLGEQSALSLRGSAMEDVIFAGSPDRPCSGLAEVSLTLDNSDGSLPIEFSEISITRRISRVGESEYLINNAPCRLLDIQELLMDSGLGKEMYSIVSQGKLEQILMSRPEERRLLIEEAAGVLKHERRKDRALRKLASMEQNLVRAKDILKEVNRQLQPLQRQARKAENFRKFSEHLRSLEIALSVNRLGELQDRWAGHAANESNWGKSLRELKNQIFREEENKQRLRAEVESEQSELMKLEEEKRRLQMCEDRLKNRYLLAAEKGKTLTVRRQELHRKVRQLEEKVERRKRESLELKEKKGSFDQHKRDLMQRLESLRRALEEVQTKEKELSGDLDKAVREKDEATKAYGEKELKLKAVQSSIESHELRVRFLREQSDSYSSRIDECSNELKKSKDEFLEQRKKLAYQGKEKSRLEEKIKQENQISNQLKLNLEELKKKIATLRAEQKAFSSFRTVLGELSGAEAVREGKISGIIGVLGELITVPKEYEKAIEAVLGTDLLCLTVETIGHVEQVLSYVKKERGGPVGMVIAKGINREAPQVALNGDFVPACSIIQCDKSIRKALEYLLGEVLIVSDTKTAFRWLKQKDSKSDRYTLVTRNGEVFHSNGKVYTGAHQKLIKSLQHQTEEGLELEERRYLRDLSALEKEHISKLSCRNVLMDDLRVCANRLKEQEFALQTCINDQKRLEEEIIDTESKKKALITELRDWEQKIEAESQIATGLSREINEMAEGLDELNHRLTELTRRKQAYLEQRKEIDQKMVKTKLEIDALDEKDDYLAKQSGLISEDQAELQVLLDSEQDLERSLDQFEQRLKLLKAVFNELSELMEKFTGDVAPTISSKRNLLNELKNELGSEGKQSQILREQAGTLEEKTQNVRILKAQLEVEVKQISQKILEQFELPLDKAINKYQTDSQTDDLKAEINEIKERIKSLGTVNPVAVEDFKGLKERQEFLASQISDLMESGKALEKVAREIDKKIKDKFLQTFEKVKFNFQSIFAYLFEGGESELVLDQPEDVLNSGVSFEVHPAGKRLQKVSLLSGGEAALVALAFLFAIHHTRPSPFYILDEVEPALDSINLQRFTAFLKEQSRNTQFLVITHQKRTMEIADLLYGVSMEPDGVSSVISQKLNEFSDMEDGRIYAAQKE